MTKYLLLSLFILLHHCCFSLSIKERLLSVESTELLVGSFIVTEYQKNTSFLRIYAYTPPYLILEEINVPSHLAPKPPCDWTSWLQNKAPHHTSWLLYKTDLDQGRIIQCYSFSRQSYIALSEQPSFLTTLMTLPLHKVPVHERKKIGPPPQEDMPDTRKVWNPPKIIDGKKLKNPYFDMLKTQWPKDGSELSSKWIELYFDGDTPEFPFPYWIEIGDGYNNFKLHAIDSGRSQYFPNKLRLNP